MTMEEQPLDVENAPAATKDETSDSGTSPADAEGGSGSTANSNGNPHRTIERKLSISEQAQANSSGRCRAPFWLKWIEYPFRVKNPQTQQYLEEATAHAMDYQARGPINQTGSFVGAAMINLAVKDAGGPKNTVYGIQASSILTVASLIVGITAGVTMPFVGALVDHTDHRKAMGSVSAFIVTAAVAFQLMLSEDTWFAIFILEVIGGYFLIMHQVCTMAYLPDLTHDLTAMGHYTARFMMNQYFVQGVFTTIVIGVGYNLDNIGTAKVGAGLATGLGVIFFGYSWIFLFRKRPKLREIPEGSNIFTTGFKQIAVTTKHVFKEYKALKWFMIALLFSPEAGAGTVLAIAVTFLTVFVKMSVVEIAVVSLVMLFFNIPGAFVSKKMCVLMNPLNSFRCAEVMFAVVNGLIAITVTGSTQKDKYLMNFYAALIGIAFGWMFPSQRTLAVALIPKGQETEIMGLISFFGQIVGWLPVFVFTAMNQNGVSMRWGLGSVSLFLLTSCAITFLCGSYDDAVALVAHTSDEYLDHFRRRSQNGEESGKEGSFADEEGKVQSTGNNTGTE
eukprot:CAMPEP_0181106120 /NCGR_PEP_ID=MMETSP1071-20121207/16361_1 /TAXON_ID=35127 /ORGANISM="Thalassiosira sp., Strain NH16" /LENGTH=561 /DNA_ID=CAMNT_0023189503 /DNA_START=142 /DNA_END=1827 /DNA_ORIENTATION=+